MKGSGFPLVLMLFSGTLAFSLYSGFPWYSGFLLKVFLLTFRFSLVLRFSSGTLAFSLYSGFPWFSGFLLTLCLSPYIQVFPGALWLSLYIQVFFWHSVFLFTFRFSLVLRFSSSTLVFSLHSNFLC